jgi:hypothetical protein
MIAYYLAQDAMEYVRNVRDDNLVKQITDNWLSVATGALASCNDTDCTIDTRPTFGVAEVCGGTCLMNKNTTGTDFLGYVYGSGVPTIFSRKIRIEKPNGDRLESGDSEARVTVVVSWPTFTGQKSITLVENLFKQI